MPLKYREGRGLLEVLDEIVDSASNTEESQDEEEHVEGILLSGGVLLKPHKMFGFRNYYSDWRDGINFHRVPPVQHNNLRESNADPYRPLSRVKRSFVRRIPFKWIYSIGYNRCNLLSDKTTPGPSNRHSMNPST